MDWTLSSEIVSCGHHESPSASAFFNPGRYFREKSYNDNSASQRCPVASSFADVNTYVKGLLSVST